MHILDYSNNKEVEIKYSVHFIKLPNWIYEVLNMKNAENINIKMMAAFQKDTEVKRRERPFTDKDYVTEKDPAFNKIKKIIK